MAWCQEHPPAIEPDRVWTRSAGDGEFRLDGLHRERAYELLLRATGYATRVVAVPALAGVEGSLELGELRLEAPALLADRVVDASSAGLAAGLTLAVAPDGAAGTFLERRSFWSDDEGRFVLGELAPGRYTLRAWSDGRVFVEGYELELSPGEERTDLVLEVARGLAIRGLVIDEAGRPVPEVFVHATREDGERGLASGSKATTDVRGWFALEGLAEGTHRLSASRRDEWIDGAWLESRQLAGVEAGGAPLELVLRALDGRIAGVVVDADGAPVPDACVWIERGDERGMEPVRCDAAGRFVLPLPGDAPVELVARRTRHLSHDASPTYAEFKLGRLLSPPEDGEARAPALLPGDEHVVLVLRP